MTSRDYKQLDVWERSHAFVLALYRATRGFPADERFGLTSQIRRAALSIPSNIAEGCGRGGESELARFMEMANGSTSEVHYQVLLAKELEYLASEEADALLDEAQRIGRMLSSYRARLKR